MATEKFSRQLAVKADPARTWDVLTDVEQLSRWVGIVHDVVELSRLDKYTAVLQDRVGPFTLKADLEITADVIQQGRHIRIAASGRDRAVDSRISVTAELRLNHDGAGTSIAVEGTYQVTGRVASMGGGVIRKKADRVIEDFFSNADAELNAV